MLYWQEVEGFLVVVVLCQMSCVNVVHSKELLVALLVVHASWK